jgi:hypothetical protein
MVDEGLRAIGKDLRRFDHLRPSLRMPFLLPYRKL